MPSTPRVQRIPSDEIQAWLETSWKPPEPLVNFTSTAIEMPRVTRTPAQPTACTTRRSAAGLSGVTSDVMIGSTTAATAGTSTRTVR